MEPREYRSGTGVKMSPIAPGEELVGDGGGEALPPILERPIDAPQCYGNPTPELEEAQCIVCPVLHLCVRHVEISEGLTEPVAPTPRGPEPGTATIRVGDGPEVPFGHIDKETGEFVGDHPLLRQPTLDPVLFPPIERRQVPMVKIGFTGTVEMTQAEWESYCNEGLEPGREVKLTMTGYLPNPHAKWVKRSESQEDGSKESWWEQEGQVKIKALELGSFELRGFYDGD